MFVGSAIVTPFCFYTSLSITVIKTYANQRYAIKMRLKMCNNKKKYGAVQGDHKKRGLKGPFHDLIL